MKTLHKKKPSDQTEIAKERIATLFKEAESADQGYSDRYVEIARRIAMKYKIKIPIELKRRFCKNCQTYLRPGVNCRVRTRKGRLIYYCKKCKNYSRYPGLGKNKKQKSV